MKKIGLVILFLSAFVSSAFAQVELNPRFDEQSNSAIGEANSSCNVVSEPFFKFICSFRDDEDFRNERIKINVEYEVEDYETMGADDVPEENSFEFFEEAYNIDIENDAPTYLVYSASWFDVTSKRVCYARGEACDDGTIDAEVIYIFEFNAGKWYLTSYLELPSEDDESESEDEDADETEEEDDEEYPAAQ